MANIVFAGNVVLPLLVLMILGYFARTKNFIAKETVSQCNTLIFKIFLPVLLFENVRASSLSELNEFNLFVFVFVFLLLAFAVTTFIVIGIEKDNKKRGVMIQGIARSNYALFGIPLFTLLFPDGNIAIASILIAIVIPVVNVCSVIVLTYFGAKTANTKVIILAILKNPLIIATLLGLVALFSQVQFPVFVEESIQDVASIASPFALFLLGAGFEFKRVSLFLRQLSISVLGRLVLLPATALLVAIALGFRNEELGCVMVVFASPTAVSSFTMAESMGGDADLAAAIVVFSSAFCVFTLFLAILVLKSFGFI